MHARLSLHCKRFSAYALAVAGLLVLCAATRNQFLWGSRAANLTMVALAILLALAAMASAQRRQIAEPGGLRSSGYLWLLLTALLVLHGFVAAYVIRGGEPQIDCFIWQRDAAATLLQGRDPYGTSHVNIYDADASRRFYGPGMVANGRVLAGLTYPPATLLSALPGYLLGDVRFGYVAAILISAIFVFALFPDERGLLLAAFVLQMPTTYYLEYECWTEPLMWMLLCATVYAAIRRPRWLPLALGLFLASKQYNFLALPFIGYLLRPFSWKAYWKLLGLSLAVAMATVLPFALWNFRALWHDLVFFIYAVPVRRDALSFAIPFPAYAKIGLLLLFAFLVWGARRGARQPAMFAAAYGTALLLFFSASKMAYLNYYFLSAQALLLAAASLGHAEETRPPVAEGRIAVA
ncbi:MAG: hypothetical protein ABSG10_08905 [Terracidiphilus sp.]